MGTRLRILIAILFTILLGGVVLFGPSLASAYFHPLVGKTEYLNHRRLSDDIEAIRTALASYKSRNGRYPTTAEGLAALGLPTIPKDPWNSDYIYRHPGWRFPNTFELFSAGPDRIPDTADDDWGL